MSSAQNTDRKGTILIVEDWQPNVLVAELMLDMLGYNTMVAMTGEAAVSLFEANAFDAILMDIRLPGMDGYETTAQIREREKSFQLSRTPIIATTAYATKEDRERCLASDMDNYMSKPLDADLLGKMLEGMIAPVPAKMAHS